MLFSLVCTVCLSFDQDNLLVKTRLKRILKVVQVLVLFVCVYTDCFLS